MTDAPPRAITTRTRLRSASTTSTVTARRCPSSHPLPIGGASLMEATYGQPLRLPSANRRSFALGQSAELWPRPVAEARSDAVEDDVLVRPAVSTAPAPAVRRSSGPTRWRWVPAAIAAAGTTTAIAQRHVHGV